VLDLVEPVGMAAVQHIARQRDQERVAVARYWTSRLRFNLQRADAALHGRIVASAGGLTR